jgi:hypothetical protein
MAHFAERQRRARRIVARRAVAIVQRYRTGNIADPVGVNILAGGDKTIRRAYSAPRPYRCV